MDDLYLQLLSSMNNPQSILPNQFGTSQGADNSANLDAFSQMFAAQLPLLQFSDFGLIPSTESQSSTSSGFDSLFSNDLSTLLSDPFTSSGGLGMQTMGQTDDTDILGTMLMQSLYQQIADLFSNNSFSGLGNAQFENIAQVRQMLQDLDVENNERYRQNRQGMDETYCNIFASDFAQKMGAPLPQTLDFDQDGQIEDHLDANEMVRWLRGDYQNQGQLAGPQHGWQQVDETTAAMLAGQGYVVLAGWESASAAEPGHLAVVRPESTPGSLRIAQAGGRNFSDGSLSQGFGSNPATFFVHPRA